jgi:hypothetical protein
LLGKPPTVYGPITVAIACSDTTGGLRPRSWLRDVRSLRKTTFGVHKRTFTRAAGVSPPWQAKRDYDGAASQTRKRTPSSTAIVSPPWFSEPHLQVERDEFRRLDRACGVHPTERLRPPARGCMRDISRAICVSDSQRRMCPTGGLRQPLLVGNASAGRMMRIPAASSTVTSLRTGARPAHMRIYLRTRYVHHGGLTPPALVADTTSIRRKNDDSCDEQTHVHKSGGRQPAVACETRWSCESTRNGSRRARGA